MAWHLSGRLVAEDGSESQSLSEYRVEVVYNRLAGALRLSGGLAESRSASVIEEGEASPRIREERAATSTGSAGDFVLPLPDRALLTTTMRVMVAAPSGTVVGEAELPVDAMGDSLEIGVKAVGRIAPEGPSTPPRTTYHVNGKVLDRDGACLPECMQLVVYGKRPGGGAAEKEGLGAPLLAEHLDAAGYFFGDLTDEPLASATAVVSGMRRPIPIALADGRLPERLVVVGELDPDRAHDAHDCACGGARSLPRAPGQSDLLSAPETYTVDLGSGGCVDFTVPNRAIEEFDFYSVVRTTEPEIRGVTLEDPVWQTSPLDGGAGPGGSPPPRDVVARSYEVRLDTGARGTWGAIRVYLTTEAGGRVLLLAKNSVNEVGGLLPGAAAIRDMALTENSSRAFGVTSGMAIGLDMDDVTGVELEWVESNWGDAWAFQGIGIVAVTGSGRVPILIQGATNYREEPSIKEFADSGSQALTWSAEAQVGELPRPLPAAAPPPGVAVSAPPPAPPPAPGRTGRDRLQGDNAIDWDSSPTFYEAATRRARAPAALQAGLARGRLLARRPALQPAPGAGPEEADLRRRLGAHGSAPSAIELTTEREAAVRGTSRATATSGEVVTGALTESVAWRVEQHHRRRRRRHRRRRQRHLRGDELRRPARGVGRLRRAATRAPGRTPPATSRRRLAPARCATTRCSPRPRSAGCARRWSRPSSQGESTRVTHRGRGEPQPLPRHDDPVLRGAPPPARDARAVGRAGVPVRAAPDDRVRPPEGAAVAHALETYLSRPGLASGFDAARRVQTNWSEVDYPAGRTPTRWCCP